MSSPTHEGWKIPEGYYEHIAQSNVSGIVHWAGRMVVAPLRYANYGTPIVDTSPEFERYQASGTFTHGNIIITPTHRSALETVTHPAIFEQLGLHHARPITKRESNMDHPVVRWFMHRLGAFAVEKKSPNVQGVSLALNGILNRGGIATVYVEGTRIHSAIEHVAPIETGAIIGAIQNDSLIIPLATAGMSSIKKSMQDGKRIVIAQDQKAPLGRNPHQLWRRGLPVVHSFGDPYRLPRPDFEFSLERGRGVKVFRQSREFVHHASDELRMRMQAVLTRAYALRSSMLEDVLREDLL